MQRRTAHVLADRHATLLRRVTSGGCWTLFPGHVTGDSSGLSYLRRWSSSQRTAEDEALQRVAGVPTAPCLAGSHTYPGPGRDPSPRAFVAVPWSFQQTANLIHPDDP